MAIDTHFQQNLVDLTFFVGTVTRLSIPQSSLTNGDRYIALWKGLVGQAGGRTRLQLRIDGTLVTGQRGTRAAAFAGARTKQISGFHVFTAGSTGNVEVEAVNVTSNSNTRDEHLLLIKLDDAMVENTDWFLNVNTTNDSTHGSSYGSENDKASITFTPDGVSDYLVIGNLKWAFTNDDDETWRIRDQTAAVTLVQTGPGGGNIGNEDANDVLMHVLQAPAAVPKTIDTEYKSFPVSIKDDARLFILRLNVFSSFGFVQTDLNATPTGARQSIGSTSVTPDANGEVIILSSLLGEVTPGFESGLGYGGDIEYNSSIVFAATTPSASRNISASGGPTKAEAWVGPAFFGKLTGQPVSSTPVEGFIDAFNNNGFQHTLRTQTVVAFSTELFITPPPGGISDQAGNPLAPTTVGSMIGFIEPPATSELLPLDMYDFLIFPIRDLDFKKGDLFVKRFLRGSQQIWRDTQTTIFGIKDLLSVQDCPDEFLQFLKNLVGWTSDPITERVTRNLDFDTLRRLIDASVPLWKTRGPEDTIINFLRLLTTKRLRIWNWFNFRFILDETIVNNENHQGRDPFIIDLPGPPNNDDKRFNIRIVEDGNEPILDRALVRNVAKLVRPVGERIEISYITFLDLFNTDDDDFQWILDAGTLITVKEGRMFLDDDTVEEIARVNVGGSSDWEELAVYTRIQPLLADTIGEEVGLTFYATDSLNYYRATIDIADNKLKLTKVVAGVATLITSFDFSTILTTLTLDEGFFGLRVVVVKDGGTNRIKVYLDGDERIDTTDSTFTKGSVGLYHSSGATLLADEVEMFLVPLDTDIIDINNVVILAA